MKKIRPFILIIFLLGTSCTEINKGKAVMIPMRDGTKLSTRLVFPEIQHDKYPVIFIRTPYQKERLAGHFAFLVDNGYVLALQDVRGRFDSEGEFEPFVNESKDGYDAIEWIASQSWCDGNIGMIGMSYDGWVQYCAATEKPPHLKTIIPSCALVDLFYDMPYRYGIFVPYSLLWSEIIEEEATIDVTGKKLRKIYSKNWEKHLQHLPVSEQDSKIISKELSYYQKWVQHETKDNYWKQSCTLEKLKEIKIPVFIQSGWFDTQLQESKLAYNELNKSGNKNVKLIIGPWEHSDRESKFVMGKQIGEAADDINLQSQFLRWFNYWLKQEENGIMDEPMVQLYTLKSDKWYSGNTYPMEITTDRKLFLSSSNGALLKTNSGDLTFEQKDSKEGYGQYLYNPENVPVYRQEMKDNFNVYKEMLAERDDYLFYKTTVFERPMTILGQISATIFASSSAPDTDWFLILLVLDKDDNFIEPINFGMLRAKFRNSFEKPELLKQDSIYQFNIDMNHYGITLEPGQKIGLIITSTFFYPYFAKNLNTGKNSQTETDYQVAGQKIFHTNKYNSHISIPVLNDNPNFAETNGERK